MSAIAFRAEVTADGDEMSNFAQNVWENVADTVDEKIYDQAWDAVSRQVADAISEDAWDIVSDNVYESAREAANDAVQEYGGDSVSEALSDLLRQYDEISVGNHCTIGTRATALVTKVIQWHLDTSADDGGLLSHTHHVDTLESEVERQIEGANEGLQRVTVLEDKVAGLAEENALLWVKVNDLTGMVSRQLAESHGFRPKYDTPEGTLAQAESTLKHILIAVQDKREAVRIAEPF